MKKERKIVLAKKTRICVVMVDFGCGFNSFGNFFVGEQ